MFVLGIFGLLAGALTTVATLGGGMFLVVALTLVLGPHAALILTAPALLVGNLHRAWVYRAELDRRIALSFALGALPGAALGGVVAARLPEGVLTALIVVSALVALARATGHLRFEPPRWALGPVGAGIAILGASSGGSGLLPPVLMAAGLRAKALLATASVCAVVVHVGRIAGYGAGGMLDASVIPSAALLAAGIVIGNLAGARLRVALGESRCEQVGLGVLVLSVAGSLARYAM